MEKKGEDKNYTKMMEKEGAKKKAREPKVTIHTMPKRYMAFSPDTANAKSTGLLILILGFLFLVLALLLFYFYILKDPIVTVDPEPTSPVVTDPVEPTKPDPEPEPAKPTATTTKPVQASSTPIKKINASSNDDYQNATDSDRDGLSDLEELVLGSSPNSDDTDGDGYTDRLEVISLYDPASKSRIIESVNVEEYSNDKYEYNVFIASVWTVDSISGEDSLIVSLGKDQYIQIIAQDNVNEQSIDEWYKEIFEVDEIKDSQVYKKGNWSGVIADSRLTYYLEHPSKKYFITINYEIGDDNTLYYKNIFDMMLASISIN